MEPEQYEYENNLGEDYSEEEQEYMSGYDSDDEQDWYFGEDKYDDGDYYEPQNEI